MDFSTTITDLSSVPSGKSVWSNSTYRLLKETSTTDKGTWAENLLCKILGRKGIEATRHCHGRGGYDVEAPGQRTEVKLATQDVGGKFQFNGIDLKRSFDAGFLLGVSPNELFFLYLPKRHLKPWVSPDGGFSKWTLSSAQMVRLTEENFWASWTALNVH